MKYSLFNSFLLIFLCASTRVCIWGVLGMEPQALTHAMKWGESHPTQHSRSSVRRISMTLTLTID